MKLFLFLEQELLDVFWKKGDGGIIDGTINGIAMGIIPFVTRISLACSLVIYLVTPSVWC